MEYTGKLYGKIGRRQIPLTLTSEDVDKLERQNKALKYELACVKFQRDALLRMTWLDLPDDSDEESTKEWERLFEEGWERRALSENANVEPPSERKANA
jgi:hypothetical protein